MILNDPMNTNVPEIILEARKKKTGEVIGTSPYSTQLICRAINGVEDDIEY